MDYVLDDLNVPVGSPAEHDFKRRQRQEKARRLRALASLAVKADQMRLIAHQLGQLGMDTDAGLLHETASHIEEVFDMIAIPGKM